MVNTISAAGVSPLRVIAAACCDLSIAQASMRASALNMEAINRLQTSGIRPTAKRLVLPDAATEKPWASSVYATAASLFEGLHKAATAASSEGHLKSAPSVVIQAQQLKRLVSGRYAPIRKTAQGLRALSEFSHVPLSALHAALTRRGFTGSLEAQVDQIFAELETLKRECFTWNDSDAALVAEAFRRIKAAVKHARESMPLAQALALHGICEFAKVAFTDVSRPAILPAPPAWMNDPVGVHINRQGELVIYHQLNPFSIDLSSPMTALWDNMHYGKYVMDFTTGDAKIMPPVMAPMPAMDEDHCYSGSRFVARDGRVGLWYTSIGPFSGFSDAAVQRVAWASDHNENWFVQEERPALTEAVHPEGLKIYEWRDPKVFEHGGRIYMLLGGALNPRVDKRIPQTLVEGAFGRSANQNGVIALYRAVNDEGTDWEYAGLLLEEPDTTMLECPNIVDIEGRQLLVYYPGRTGKDRHSIYRLGRLGADGARFDTERTGRVDYGDMFAPTLFKGPQGRAMLIGWVKVDIYRRHWKEGYPEGRGWSGCFTSPRFLKLRDGKLWQIPLIPEGLRGATWQREELVLDHAVFNAPLKARTARIQMTLTLEGEDVEAGCIVRCDEEGQGGVRIAVSGNELVVGEKRMPLTSSTVTLDIVVDNSVIEIFADGTPLTHVYDPHPERGSIRFFSTDGKATFHAVEVCELKPRRVEIVERIGA